MQLIPLQQWICDVCGEVIQCPGDGYVQWNRNSNLEIDDFIIVHHKTASPREHSRDGCYRYSSDSDLPRFLGVHGQIELTSLLDPGVYHLPKYSQQVVDIRKWVDFYRRLQLPYYEEARRYWSVASSNGYFAGLTQVCIYLPDNLKRMIEQYEQKGP